MKTECKNDTQEHILWNAEEPMDVNNESIQQKSSKTTHRHYENCGKSR